MKAPPNKGGAKTIEIDSKPYVMISNPVHGPIDCDDAMMRAAHLAVAAQPGTKLKLGALITAILKEQAK